MTLVRGKEAWGTSARRPMARSVSAMLVAVASIQACGGRSMLVDEGEGAGNGGASEEVGGANSAGGSGGKATGGGTGGYGGTGASGGAVGSGADGGAYPVTGGAGGVGPKGGSGGVSGVTGGAGGVTGGVGGTIMVTGGVGGVGGTIMVTGGVGGTTPSRGGSPGRGGSGGSVAGAGGAGDQVLNACNHLCSRWPKACAAQLPDDGCFEGCAPLWNAYPGCELEIADYLECYANALDPGAVCMANESVCSGPGCSTTVGEQCAPWLELFNACVSGSCGGAFSVIDNKLCEYQRTCGSHEYGVDCFPTDSTGSWYCTCYLDGRATLTRYFEGSVSNVCFDAAAYCDSAG